MTLVTRFPVKFLFISPLAPDFNGNPSASSVYTPTRPSAPAHSEPEICTPGATAICGAETVVGLSGVPITQPVPILMPTSEITGPLIQQSGAISIGPEQTSEPLITAPRSTRMDFPDFVSPRISTPAASESARFTIRCFSTSVCSGIDKSPLVLSVTASI